MKQSIMFEVPDGFRLIEKEFKVGIDSAKSLLLSKKRRNLTSAVRIGDEAIITRHVIECPYCRRQAPAYYRYVGKAPPVSNKAILKWAEPQYSLFESSENKLVFNTIYNPKEIYKCQCCKQESRPFHENNVIQLSSMKYKLLISCVTSNPKSVLALMKNSKVKLDCIHFPLSEVLEFNMRNGHSSISIRDAEDKSVLVMDITGGNDWSGTIIYKLIDTNDLMKRKLYTAFTWIYPGGIPFEVNELSPLNAVAMTRFKGFSRVFYDAIPYESWGENIDPSFISLVKKIHQEHDIPIVLENSALPKAKSFRRIVFSSPGFIFYTYEMEMLWAVMEDINYFTRILEADNAFVILSFLHQYPGTMVFLRDYKRLKGVANMFLLMSKRWREVSEYSLQYCSMSLNAQKKERESWKHVKSPLQAHHGPSIPMPTGPKEIKDCSIEGFSFEWLRTRSDYRKAGISLNNCLKEWTPFSNPVVVVKRNEKTVAAVEVQGRSIVQVKGENNSTICHDADLYSAYEQWKNRFSLAEIPGFILDY